MAPSQIIRKMPPAIWKYRSSKQKVVSMEAIDVPETTSPPEGPPYGLLAADWLLTFCIKGSNPNARMRIEAEYIPQQPSIDIFVAKFDGENYHPTEKIGEFESLSLFRHTLARFGHHYMGRKLYGGHSIIRVQQSGGYYKCSIFMSNDGRSDFWIKFYLWPENEH